MRSLKKPLKKKWKSYQKDTKQKAIILNIKLALGRVFLVFHKAIYEIGNNSFV